MADHTGFDLFRLLDELAANAMPALVQQSLGGWRLRAAHGVTRRANSVLTAAPQPSYPGWLPLVEEFYARRGLPSRFQISDGSPPDLDAFLEQQGYAAEARTLVQTAPAALVIERAAPLTPLQVVESGLLDPQWLDDFILIEQLDASNKATYHAIFSAVGPRTLFIASKSPEGETTAVGRAATERGWAGTFSIATAPQYRGRGIATHLLSRIATWSLVHGAPDLYLQVVGQNTTAIRLYARLGFSTLYSYHYRTKELETLTPSPR